MPDTLPYRKFEGTLLYAQEIFSFSGWLPSSGTQATSYGFKNRDGKDESFLVKGITGFKQSKAKVGDSITIYEFPNGRGVIVEVRGKEFPHTLGHYYFGITETPEYAPVFEE